MIKCNTLWKDVLKPCVKMNLTKIHKYGDVDQLNKITPSSLKSHFEDILKTSLIDIIVIGDIDSEEVRAKVDDTSL